MATRALFKLKPNLSLPLRFFRNTSFSLTRPVSTFTRPVIKPSTLSFQGTLARQMATSRSPRGASKIDEDDNDEGDFDDEDTDDGEEDEFDLNDEFDGSDGDEFDDEDEEEKEKPKGKNSNTKK